jgi:hypothetical protein
VLLLLSIAIAGAALWSVCLAPPTRPRTGDALAILVLLPFGAGYLLRRSIRRRRAVLAAITRS